jgi:hypothetical protein
MKPGEALKYALGLLKELEQERSRKRFILLQTLTGMKFVTPARDPDDVANQARLLAKIAKFNRGRRGTTSLAWEE